MLLQFRKEISLVEVSAREATLEFPWGKTTLRNMTPGLLAALRTLASGGATEDALSDVVLDLDGASALTRLYYHLQRFGNLCLLQYGLAAHEPLVTVVPMTPGFQLRRERLGADARFRLSRFAYCRREADALAVESPLSLARAILPGHAGAALVAELVQPRSAHDLSASVDGLDDDTAGAFLGLLACAGIVSAVSDDGTLPEDANPILRQWEFHDLLFHSRSRMGRHDYPVGGTFRFLNEIPPLPALKPKMSDDAIPLYKPDVHVRGREELPFSHLLEERRSIRAYADRAITLRQLGEFLYRVGRVRHVAGPDPARGLQYEVSSRPYPSGGATYDLELYVTVNICADLPPGIYHYDPLNHELHKLAERNARVEALLRDARFCAALSCEPQVLITLASRFQRLSWKYSSCAYAVTLKNVGVLYQTMYLVATAMGLAPCALGGGNSALFAEAVGTDYFAESSVGEFLLGSAAPHTRR